MDCLPLSFPKTLKLSNTLFLAVLAVLLASAAPVALRAETAEALILKGDAFDKELKTSSALSCYLEALKQEPKNPWILGKLAKQYGSSMADTSSWNEKRKRGEIALGYSQRAVEIAPENALSNLSLAVCYGRVAPYLDSKTKIEYSKLVKRHVEKSIAIDPSNDLSYYVLGAWHFELANLNPFMVTVAKWIYGDIPKATNEEAVQNFKKAISINPKRIGSYVELGRAYAAMGKADEARGALRKALSLPNREKDDPEAKIRAKTALEKLE